MTVEIKMHVFKNIIDVIENEKLFLAVPHKQDGGIVQKIKDIVINDYDIMDEKDNMVGQVFFKAVSDGFVVKGSEGEEVDVCYKLKKNTFNYNDKEYEIHEKLDGRVFITTGESDEPVAKGTLPMLKPAFSFDEYDDSLVDIIKQLSVGITIRSLTMFKKFW